MNVSLTINIDSDVELGMKKLIYSIEEEVLTVKHQFENFRNNIDKFMKSGDYHLNSLISRPVIILRLCILTFF